MTQDRPPILRAKNIHRHFRMGDSSVPVLKGADLTLKPGEFVAIEGRSGSGKSTLLHILGALDGVHEGAVEFNGKDYTRHADVRLHGALRVISSWNVFWAGLALILAAAIFYGFSPARPGTFPPGYKIALALSLAGTLCWAFFLGGWIARGVLYYLSERPAAELRNRDFGFVFQFYHLLPELSVLENTLLTPMVENSWLGFRSRRKEMTARAQKLLTELGLSHRLKHRPSQLSGGERQRVAIARALMNNPRVLYADEPTGNLDLETGRQIMSVLERLHKEQGQTIVMVTHDRTLARQADRVLVLRDGKLENAA
jgi:lipoprotein-releasing system ATP-binding protein